MNQKTLFDFQTAATRLRGWEIVNDGVMGGESTSQFQPSTNGGAVFSGTVRLEVSWIKASPAIGEAGGAQGLQPDCPG